MKVESYKTDIQTNIGLNSEENDNFNQVFCQNVTLTCAGFLLILKCDEHCQGRQ